MSNKNNQEIIKRINDINTELGLTNSPPVGGGGSVSLRDLSEQIIQKLTSTNSSDINGKVLDIFNKIQTIYNWSSNTDTKTNQIYTWFSNIYDELNSTSTSYMKGKINSIYKKIITEGNYNRGACKSVQRGGHYMHRNPEYPNHLKIYISRIDPSKSILLVGFPDGGNGSYYFFYRELFATYFSVGFKEDKVLVNHSFVWQVIEFY